MAARAGPAGSSAVATTGVLSERRSPSSRSATSNKGRCRGLNMPELIGARQRALEAREGAAAPAKLAAQRGIDARCASEAGAREGLSPPRLPDTLLASRSPGWRAPERALGPAGGGGGRIVHSRGSDR